MLRASQFSYLGMIRRQQERSRIGGLAAVVSGAAVIKVPGDQGTIQAGIDAAAGSVSLHVYSISGRRLATLLSGRKLAAGEHQVRCDGRDRQGRRLASGVYLYELLTEDGRVARKITLLK